MRTYHATLLLTLLVPGLTGCGRKPDATTDGGSSSGGASDSAGTTSVGMSSETVPTTSDAGTDSDSASTTTPTSAPTSITTDPTTGTTDTPDPTTGDGTTMECIDSPLPETTTDDSTSTTNGGACQDPEDQPQSAQCSDASGCGCASGKCFVIPILGGFCSECLDDDDCPGGCTIPNPLAGIGATCNLGGPAAGCGSDVTCLNSCAGQCGLVLGVPGIIDVSTCGQCKTDAECTNPRRPNCTPEYDVENFTGQLVCKADGSVPNGEGCSLTEDGMGEPLGNAACQSGKCGQANVMGLLKFGICGECNSNADCQGQSCTDPVVDLESGTLVPAMCQ
jgi:hypothetical protein